MDSVSGPGPCLSTQRNSAPLAAAHYRPWGTATAQFHPGWPGWILSGTVLVVSLCILWIARMFSITMQRVLLLPCWQFWVQARTSWGMCRAGWGEGGMQRQWVVNGYFLLCILFEQNVHGTSFTVLMLACGDVCDGGHGVKKCVIKSSLDPGVHSLPWYIPWPH